MFKYVVEALTLTFFSLSLLCFWEREQMLPLGYKDGQVSAANDQDWPAKLGSIDRKPLSGLGTTHSVQFCSTHTVVPQIYSAARGK